MSCLERNRTRQQEIGTHNGATQKLLEDATKGQSS